MLYHTVHSVALTIGPFTVYWYGLMYLLSFCLIGCGLKYSKRYFLKLPVADFVFYLALAAVIGGRIGYVLFYGYRFLLHDPFFPFP